MAVDADGDAVFAWAGSNGTAGGVKARTLSAAGVLGPVETLSDLDQFADSPDVAVDADGDAAVTWRRSDGANQRIQAAFGP